GRRRLRRSPRHPPHLRPPVDPWPHAASVTWRPDPDATVATSPPEYESRTPVPPQRKPGPPSRPQRAQQPVVIHSRPVSPAVGSARPVSPPPRATAAVPQPTPEPALVRRPRRRGRIRRALQILLSLVVMITVPIAALILAFGYGNDATIEQDAVDVFKQIAELLGLR
ncbi:hypothetical protein AB0C31_04550, partial [Actinoplanes philippinensis]